MNNFKKYILFITIFFVCLINKNLTFAESFDDFINEIRENQNNENINLTNENTNLTNETDNIFINAINKKDDVNFEKNTFDIPENILIKLDNKLKFIEEKYKYFTNAKKIKVYKKIKKQILVYLMNDNISTKKKNAFDYMIFKIDEIILNLENIIKQEVKNKQLKNMNIFEYLPINDFYGKPIIIGKTGFKYSNINSFEAKKDDTISSVICNDEIINSFLQTNYSWSYRNSCRSLNQNVISFNVLYLEKDNYFYEKHYLDKKNGLYGKILLESGTGISKDDLNIKNKELKLKEYEDTKIVDDLFTEIDKLKNINNTGNINNTNEIGIIDNISSSGIINFDVFEILPKNENSYGNPITLGTNLFSYSSIDFFEIKQDNNIFNIDCSDEKLNNFLQTNYSWSYRNTCKSLGENIITFNVIYLLKDNYFYEKHYLDKKNGLYGKILLESGAGVLKDNLITKNKELKLKEYKDTKKTDELFLDIDKK